MIFYKTEARSSPIAGKGLFALEAIARGAIIGDITHNTKVTTEAAYQQAQREGNEHMIKCCVRVAADYYVYNTPAGLSEGILDNEDYMNHSAKPSMLYHCGLLFALRDIASGEELTVDYKYLLAPDDVCSFNDIDTGGWVTGLESRAALTDSTRALLDLLTQPAKTRAA